MTANDHDIDKLRRRWAAERDLIHLSQQYGADFGLGGLGSLCSDLDVRVVTLPSDPHAQPVDLDETILGWLQTQRDHEYRDVTDFGQARVTSSAAIIHDRIEEGKYNWFYGINRHGGIDAGHSLMSRVIQEGRFFFLRQIISFAWLCLDLQKEASQRWEIPGPFEMTLGLRETKGGFLSGFAEGWDPPFSVYRHSKPCLEENVLLRWEFDNDFESRQLAMDVGLRIENAFGSVEPRYLARHGDFAGEFDPR